VNGIVVRNIRRAAAAVVESLGRLGVGTVHEAQGNDPETGHHYDDTRCYIDSIDWLNEADRTKIFEGNTRKVYARLRRA
jgi:hypothetical protein